MTHKEKAMAALLTSDTQAEAAAKTGITVRTLRGYFSDPAFSAEYKRRKRQLVSDATRQIQASYHSAIKALRDIVESDSSSANEKISAARALLEYGLRFTDTNEILTGIEDLEQMIHKENHYEGDCA